MPPTVRMTDLGIRQVPADLIEAADSYGSTAWQKLFIDQLIQDLVSPISFGHGVSNKLLVIVIG